VAARRTPCAVHPVRAGRELVHRGTVTARTPRPGSGPRSPPRGPRPPPTSVPSRPAPAAIRPGRPGRTCRSRRPAAIRSPSVTRPIVPAAFREPAATAVLTGPLSPAPLVGPRTCPAHDDGPGLPQRPGPSSLPSSTVNDAAQAAVQDWSGCGWRFLLRDRTRAAGRRPEAPRPGTLQ